MVANRIVHGIRPVPEEAIAQALPAPQAEELTDYLKDIYRLFRQVQDGDLLTGTSTDTGSSGPGPPGPPGSGSPGPPGSPAPGTTPDLTPPPTPTGLTVTAGFAHILIQWDVAVYTQGHGNLQTNIYGAKWPSGSPPTFSNAVLIGSAPQADTIFAHPTEMSTRWCIWIKFQSRDGVESVAPAGGVNGVQATTGVIGNADLGPLIVDAGNLASGAVTATKLADGAIGLTKFAAGIEPVSIVGSLPNPAGYTGARTVFLTTDNKLYRYTGTIWTAAVPAVDLTGQIINTQIADGSISTPKLQAQSVTTSILAANSVTANELAANSVIAGKIAAAAVNTQQLVAGAVTTDKLLVTGRGAALNDDPNFQDATAWTLVFSSNPGSFVNVVDGVVGSTALQSGIAGLNGSWYNGRRIAFDPAKTYRVRGRWRNQGAGNGVVYVGAALFDSAGTNIAGDGGQWFYPVAGVTPTVAWQSGVGEFGFGTAHPFPVQARTMAPLVILNWNSTVGSMQAQDLRIEEKTPADLIVDGSIIASKLAANAIAVGSAAIQNGAIVNAMIANLTVDDAKIVNVSVAKLLAASMQVGSFIQSTNYVNLVSGWRISADGALELRNNDSSRVLHLQASGSQPVLRVPGIEIQGSGSATFSGALSAASGTFAGALIAATGTFAGSLSAATGTFAGALSAATGSFFSTAAAGNTKRITLNESGSNEARFYGDRGDGTIEILASIGINSGITSSVIGLFGSANSSRVGIQAQSSSNVAIYGQTASGVAGVQGVSTGGAGSGSGVLGSSTAGADGVAGSSTSSGSGVVGTSSTGHGGRFQSNATRGALLLIPSGTPSTPVNGSAYIDGAGRLWIGNGSAWNKVAYISDIPPPPVTCFPAGALVLMADLTWRVIEAINVGDMLWGPLGPEAVRQVDRPVLGGRRLLAFDDGHTWSEEHAHWTLRDGKQWWWAADPDLWRREVALGAIGGLRDNSTMRGGDNVEFAHVDGWKYNRVRRVPSNPDMQLYLPLTGGSPIVVNGYLVGAGVNEFGFDYTALDWMEVKPNAPRPKPSAAPKPAHLSDNVM